MRNQTLGTIGMLGAPFLFIDLIFHSGKANGVAYTHTSLGGFFSLLYITAWICSIAGLWQLQATGKNKLGKALLSSILFTLCLANTWNVYEIIDPEANTPLYAILDLFWPISNIMMLIVGIAVVTARQITGWKRYVPLMAGLWFPFSITILLLMGKSAAVMYFSGLYSAVSWLTLGYVIRSYRQAKQPSSLKTNPSRAESYTSVT